MFADVEIVTSTADHVLVIPDEAIQRVDEQQMVFVATDAHTFAKRLVKTGHTQNGNIEIVDGLKEGERVVTKGSFLLKSELLKSEFGE
jgi:multidrug efflux pump subunit AcrA (membrane-fusion protein)